MIHLPQVNMLFDKILLLVHCRPALFHNDTTKMLFILLALSEGNPLIIIRLLPQRFSNSTLEMILFGSANKLLNKPPTSWWFEMSWGPYDVITMLLPII